MLAALVAGSATRRCWRSWPGAAWGQDHALEEAFTGHFTDHHAFLLGSMLRRVDAISADIAALDARIAAQAAPFGDAVARLDEIPGISLASAYVILAEIGTDMTRFPTAGTWPPGPAWRPASGNRREEERQRRHRPRNAYRSVLGNAAAGAGKTNTFLGERYRRIARRRGSKRANVAIGRSILVIAWHLLSDPHARFHDLGPGYYAARIDPERRKRGHIRQLEALG